MLSGGELEQLIGFGTFDYDVQSDEGVWSDGLYHLFGYPAGDRPRVTYDWFLAHLAPDVAGHIRRGLGRNWKVVPDEYAEDFVVTTATGSRVRIQVSGRCIRNAEGLLLRCVGMMRKSADQTVQQESLQLSRYVDELRRSNRELEEFAYIASHDLQEPLRKISTFCGRLYARYHDQLTGEGSRYIDRILASADSMRTLIDNLLEYSRIARGDEPLQPTRLDVVLLGVQADLELTIEESATELSVERMPVVMGHAPQLTQLFTNLLSNAIKFRRSEVPPRIRVLAAVAGVGAIHDAGLDPALRYHCITVEDNGIGFEPEYAERIFAAFQRLHSKAEYPGSGIGLAICRKIAERHGGALTATSMPGQGARFSLLLPAHDFPAPAPRSFQSLSKNA